MHRTVSIIASLCCPTLLALASAETWECPFTLNDGSSVLLVYHGEGEGRWFTLEWIRPEVGRRIVWSAPYRLPSDDPRGIPSAPLDIRGDIHAGIVTPTHLAVLLGCFEGGLLIRGQIHGRNARFETVELPGLVSPSGTGNPKQRFEFRDILTIVRDETNQADRTSNHHVIVADENGHLTCDGGPYAAAFGLAAVSNPPERVYILDLPEAKGQPATNAHRDRPQFHRPTKTQAAVENFSDPDFKPPPASVPEPEPQTARASSAKPGQSVQPADLPRAQIHEPPRPPNRNVIAWAIIILAVLGLLWLRFKKRQ